MFYKVTLNFPSKNLQSSTSSKLSVSNQHLPLTTLVSLNPVNLLGAQISLIGSRIRRVSIRQSLRACRRRTLKSIFRSKKHSTSFKVARTLHALKRRNAAISDVKGSTGVEITSLRSSVNRSMSTAMASTIRWAVVGRRSGGCQGFSLLSCTIGLAVFEMSGTVLP